MVRAYAAMEAGGRLESIEVDFGPLAAREVEINVDHCGLCHSDLSMIDNEWRMSRYPLVPGHEVTGTVAAVGDEVRHLAVGDAVGLGWHAGYCGVCRECLAGRHNRCAEQVATIIGRPGGFADRVRAEAVCVFKLPPGVAPRTAGPLFCAGITVFTPLLEHAVSPTARVGVVGIGGLGHLALQFARAWGCEVTAFTSSEAKQADARALGAGEVINNRDAKSLRAAAGRFDLLLSTVNVNLDWNAYLQMLAPGGRLHLLGVLTEPMSFAAMGLLFGQLSVSGSTVGAPATIATMLDFAARHGIAPMTEHFPMSRVNDALDHLRAGDARYRVVLDRD